MTVTDAEEFQIRTAYAVVLEVGILVHLAWIPGLEAGFAVVGYARGVGGGGLRAVLTNMALCGFFCVS